MWAGGKAGFCVKMSCLLWQLVIVCLRLPEYWILSYFPCQIFLLKKWTYSFLCLCLAVSQQRFSSCGSLTDCCVDDFPGRRLYSSKRPSRIPAGVPSEAVTCMMRWLYRSMHAVDLIFNKLFSLSMYNFPGILYTTKTLIIQSPFFLAYKQIENTNTLASSAHGENS